MSLEEHVAQLEAENAMLREQIISKEQQNGVHHATGLPRSNRTVFRLAWLV